MKRLFLFAIFFALFALFALLACGEGPSAEQSPPTATSTRRVTSRPTATETAPPTDTPIPAPHFTVNRERVNVRTGPGIVFSIIGTVEQGDRFDIGGSNAAGDWLEFCCVNGQRGWIYAPLLIVSDEVAPIPLAQNIPTAPTPTNTPVPPAPVPQPPPSDVTIASENRCSSYNSDDYSYSQSVESQIVAQQGGRIYSPYSGRYFASTGETDIEHIVARSEAHDSGLCAAGQRHQEGLRPRPAQSHPGQPFPQPAPEDRQGPGGVAAGHESVLVRQPGRAGQEKVQPLDGPG